MSFCPSWPIAIWEGSRRRRLDPIDAALHFRWAARRITTTCRPARSPPACARGPREHQHRRENETTSPPAGRERRREAPRRDVTHDVAEGISFHPALSRVDVVSLSSTGRVDPLADAPFGSWLRPARSSTARNPSTIRTRAVCQPGTPQRRCRRRWPRRPAFTIVFSLTKNDREERTHPLGEAVCQRHRQCDPTRPHSARCRATRRNQHRDEAVPNPRPSTFAYTAPRSRAVIAIVFAITAMMITMTTKDTA